MIKLIEKYLNDNKYYPSLNELEEYYLSHPNYPSLFAIKDTLSQFNIESLALKLDLDNYENLPLSFITLFRGSLIYVFNKNNLDITYLTEELVKKKVKKEELMNEWSGIVFLIESNENSIRKVNLKSSFLRNIIVVLLGLFSLFTYEVNYLSVGVLVISITGLIVSIEIISLFFSKKIDENKFCNHGKNFSCNTVVNSNSNHISKYIDFIDLPILYFGSLYICFLLKINFYFVFSLLGIASVPMLIYSLYIQRFVFVKWCFLCLITSILVLSSSLLFLVKENNFYFNYTDFFQTIIVIFLMIASWFPVKKMVKKYQEDNIKLVSLLKFKREINTFYKTSEPIVNLNRINTLNKIIIGDIKTKNKILLFITPSCHYCHEAIKDSYKLLKNHPDDIHLEICYNLNVENTENNYFNIAKMILWNKNNNVNVSEMIYDLHIKKISYEEWSKKWFQDKDFSNEINQLKDQYDFCHENGYNFSPIRIFNDIFVSSHYHINELNHFFLD